MSDSSNKDQKDSAGSHVEVVMVRGIEPLLQQPDALAGIQCPGVPVRLDLEGVEFVSPLDLVALAAWAHALPAPLRGNVILPAPDIASYLERMRLLDLLRSSGWDVPAVETGPWEDLAHKLLEVTALAGPYEVEDLADRLPRLWRGRAGDPLKSRALHFAFGELSDNATTHSGDSPIFVAAQRYTGATSGRPARLELAVADAGIGIPSHLRSNPSYVAVQEDKEAIALSLQPGVTGTRDRRGYGFHDVLREVTEAGTGELVVVSGKGAVVTPFGEAWRRRSIRSLGGPVAGTWVLVRIYE
jgi:hypothetical protein